MTFEDALYEQLYVLPKWTPRQARLVSIVESDMTGRTPAIVTRLEQSVRQNFNLGTHTPIDWSQVGTGSVKAASGQALAIDWASILAFIEQELPTILALLMSLFAGS